METAAFQVVNLVPSTAWYADELENLHFRPTLFPFVSVAQTGRASVCGCNRPKSRPLVSIGYVGAVRWYFGLLVGFEGDFGTIWVQIKSELWESEFRAQEQTP
jgi:hypothetical protein